MEYLKISNDTELHYAIMKLNYLKEEKEVEVKRNAKELAYSMYPSEILRSAVEKLTGKNSDTANDLKTMGLNLGKDFLIMKLFGKHNTIKGFISSLLFRKAADYVIENHSDLLSKGVHKLENYFDDLKEKSND